MFVEIVTGYFLVRCVILIIFLFGSHSSYKPMGFVLFLDMNITTKLYRKQFYSAARITKRKLMEHANVSLTVLNKLIKYNLLTLGLVYMKIYVA